jgi:aminopeptidase N
MSIVSLCNAPEWAQKLRTVVPPKIYGSPPSTKTPMKQLFLSGSLIACTKFFLVALTALSFNAFAKAPATTDAYRPGEKPFSFEATPGALSKFVVPKKTAAHFNLDPYVDAYSGTVTHTVDVRKATTQIRMHAPDLKIDKAMWGDVPLSVTTDKDAQMITLTSAREIDVGIHQIDIAFSGKMTANGYGLYFTRYKDASGADRRMIATQMEPIGAREMLPNFDEPAFRTMWDIAITTDEKYTALSNMPVAKTSIANGKRRTEFASTPSMSSYLLAVTVGEFEKTTDRFENIELNIYTVATKHQHTAYAMDATKKVLAYFKDYFGSAYPLPKLDQIAVPGKRGAMENWGLITYSESLLMVDPATAAYGQRFSSFNVIAHEIAHQWFGNLVTMAWWDGLWLNESFAEWIAHKATGALNPDWNLTSRKAQAKESAMDADALSNASPIERGVTRDQNSGELFDSLTYQKGHAVLNMIERYAGESEWRDGLRDYMKKHAYGSTTSADLWAAITAKTAASGRDVQAFANKWTQQPGFPVLDASVSCKEGAQLLTLKQSRLSLRPGYVPQQTWNLAVLVSQPAQKDKAAQTTFVTLQPKQLDAGKCGEPVVVDVGGDGYYRVRYDDAMTKALDANAAVIATPDRLRLMADSWALAEAGLLDPSRTFELITALKADDAPELWMEAIGAYDRLTQLLRSGPQLQALQAHARTSLAKPFLVLGWGSKSGEPELSKSLRGDLIAALGRYGDAAVLAEARKQFAAIERGDATMDGDVRSGTLRAVGARASIADVDRLAAMMSSGKNAALEWPLLEAMASVTDPMVAKHVLNFSLSDSFPRSMAQRLVGRVARSGLHDQLALQFTQANLKKLFDRNSKYGQRYIIAAPLNNSRDSAIAAKVKALAEKHLDADARVETLRNVASVERNAWAYDAVKNKLGFLRAPSSGG